MRDWLFPSSDLLSNFPAAICWSNHAVAAAGSFFDHSCMALESSQLMVPLLSSRRSMNFVKASSGSFWMSGPMSICSSISAGLRGEIECCDLVEGSEKFLLRHRLETLLKA